MRWKAVGASDKARKYAQVNSAGYKPAAKIAQVSAFEVEEMFFIPGEPQTSPERQVTF